MTCKDCSFSRIPKYDLGKNPLELDCESPNFIASYREPTPMNGLRAEPDEGWGFRVGPDFGCIHFKHKGA